MTAVAVVTTAEDVLSMLLDLVSDMSLVERMRLLELIDLDQEPEERSERAAFRRKLVSAGVDVRDRAAVYRVMNGQATSGPSSVFDGAFR